MRVGQTQASSSHHPDDLLDLNNPKTAATRKRLLCMAQQIPDVKDVVGPQTAGRAKGEALHFDRLDGESLMVGQHRSGRLPDCLLRKRRGQ